jgi:hypothetical protein
MQHHRLVADMLVKQFKSLYAEFDAQPAHLHTDSRLDRIDTRLDGIEHKLDRMLEADVKPPRADRCFGMPAAA